MYDIPVFMCLVYNIHNMWYNVEKKIISFLLNFIIDDAVLIFQLFTVLCCCEDYDYLYDDWETS